MRDIPLSPAANSKVATELPHPAKHSRIPPHVVAVKNLICLELYFRDSRVSLLCLEENPLEEKALVEMDGWDSYMCRFTAVKKKTDFRSDA